MRTRKITTIALLALAVGLPWLPPEATAAAAPEMDAGELVAWAQPKVVLIQIQASGAPRWGTGFVADEGRVITNEHVVREARAVTVWVNGTAYRARVAAVDAARDLAALVLPHARLKLKPLTLAADAHGRRGDTVV